jgi:ribosomal protein S18 acetylase RimI-like enzyme
MTAVGFRHPATPAYGSVMRVILVEPAGEDRATIADFIAARNRDGAQHIGYLGEEVDDVVGTLADLEADAVFALAHDDGELVGVLGADWDPAVERAWLYGPYGQGVDDLYTAVAARIPPDLVQELYCAAENATVVEFAQRHGFQPLGGSLVYELRRDNAEDQPPAEALPLTPEYADPFAAMYQEIFPHAPYRPEAVAARTPPPLIVVEDGRLLGFVTLRLTPEVGNGELEHIGVSAHARGRGLGRRLLRAAVHEAFRDPRLQTLYLNTSATNRIGQSLYESVGFRRWREMVSFSRPGRRSR